MHSTWLVISERERERFIFDIRQAEHYNKAVNEEKYAYQRPYYFPHYIFLSYAIERKQQLSLFTY